MSDKSLFRQIVDAIINAFKYFLGRKEKKD